MNTCANCGLCYPDPNTDNVYRCMRGKRDPMTGLFILGRFVCDKWVNGVMEFKEVEHR